MKKLQLGSLQSSLVGNDKPARFNITDDRFQGGLFIIIGDGQQRRFMVRREFLDAVDLVQDRTYPGSSRSGPAPFDLEVDRLFSRKGNAHADKDDAEADQQRACTFHCSFHGFSFPSPHNGA